MMPTLILVGFDAKRAAAINAVAVPADRQGDALTYIKLVLEANSRVSLSTGSAPGRASPKVVVAPAAPNIGKNRVR